MMLAMTSDMQFCHSLYAIRVWFWLGRSRRDQVSEQLMYSTRWRCQRVHPVLFDDDDGEDAVQFNSIPFNANLIRFNEIPIHNNAIR